MHDVQRGYEDTFIMLHEDQLHALMGGKLRPVHLAVYVALLRRANRKRGNSCFPSLNTIAKEAGVSRSTVKEVIKDLVDAGLLKVTPRKSEEGDSASNLYTILRPATSGGQGGSGENPRVGQERTGGVGRQMTSNQMNSEPDEREPENDAGASQDTPSLQPFDLVTAFLDVSGQAMPVNRGKAFGPAKQLLQAGVTPDEVRGCTRWIMKQEWARTKGFDFSTLANQIDRWRALNTIAQGHTATIEDRFGRHVDAVAASAVPRRGKPQVIF